MELANLVVGLASFVVAALPLLFQAIAYARQLSKYEALQLSLEKESKRLTALAAHGAYGWKRVLVLLETGDLIMPHVIARFWRRLPILLTIALGTGAISAATINPHNWRSPWEFAGIALIAVNWVLQFSSFLRVNLLSQDEKAFLRNFSVLQDLFYKNFVTGLIKKFNDRCAESTTAAAQSTDLKAELDHLKEEFAKLLSQGTLKALPKPPTH